MKRLAILAIILFGCATGQNVQDQLANRASKCDVIPVGESVLCDSAKQIGVRLDDIDILVRNGVPIYIVAKYDKDPVRRDLMIAEAESIAKNVKAALEGDGDLTGSELFALIKLNSTRDKFIALAASEAIEQLLLSPGVANVVLMDADRKMVIRLLDQTMAKLHMIGGE